MFLKNLRIAVPHVGLVLMSAIYAVFGAVVFHNLEQPNDMIVKNASLHRMQYLKVELFIS